GFGQERGIEPDGGIEPDRGIEPNGRVASVSGQRSVPEGGWAADATDRGAGPARGRRLDRRGLGSRRGRESNSAWRTRPRTSAATEGATTEGAPPPSAARAGRGGRVGAGEQSETARPSRAAARGSSGRIRRRAVPGRHQDPHAAGD